MNDRLPDLLARRARQGSVHPTMDGVHAAVDRRARHRRRQRAVIAGVGAVTVLGAFGLGVVANGTSGDDARSGFATDPGNEADLPLIGIDLVGYVREPALDPDPTVTGADLTYVVFTGDQVDVLGPMMTAWLQPAEGVVTVGTPVDLGGGGEGRMVTFPGGAGVTWPVDGQLASVNGYGMPPEDVLIYAEELVGVPFDLEQMPTPDRLPNRQVVRFGPLPDFASRTAGYQGPSSVVHVVTTREPGYFDLTRIVSTEGQPYERIGFESSTLGPGEAILSPDDDGAVSALIRTDAGLTVHVFGGVDADTLQVAIEQDHLVDLTDEEAPSPLTVAPTTTVPTTTSIVDSTAPSTSAPPDWPLADIRRELEADGTETLTFIFQDEPVAVESVGSSGDPDVAPVGCGENVATFEEEWRRRVGEPWWNSWAYITFSEPIAGTAPGVLIQPQWDGQMLIVCDDAGGLLVAYPTTGTTVDPARALTAHGVTFRFH